MDWLSIILILVGLAFFEIIISVDNAIINAEVLKTMSPRARRWFLLWGIFIAVFLVRGLLPWIIVWVSNPSLGFLGSFTASFSSDPQTIQLIEQSAPILLIGGGTFLVFLFFHWLFLETKEYGLKGEQFIEKQGVWFYAIVSMILVVLCWLAIKINPLMAIGAVIGSSAFFITHGFKEHAEKMEQHMMDGSFKATDLSKIFYLEIIDMTFSIDGILGAFAFTLSVPLILIGNGLGALLVRQLTISNIERIKKYVYLKNGAMYSILVLGIIMIMHSFGFDVPEYLSPLATFIIIGFFFWKSKIHLKNIKTSERFL